VRNDNVWRYCTSVATTPLGGDPLVLVYVSSCMEFDADYGGSITIAALEADLDAALQMSPTDVDDDILSDDEDEWGVKCIDSAARNAVARVVPLANGDIHVCGRNCPFAVATHDGDLVCPLSHLVCGVVSTRCDYSTGRCTTSNDPDLTSGACTGKRWIANRVETKSKAAFTSAHTLETNLVWNNPLPTRTVKCRKPTKVDAGRQKRMRNCNKHQITVILDRLTLTKFTTQNTVGVPRDPTTDTSQHRTFDALLVNYLKETLILGKPPSFDTVHNIALSLVCKQGTSRPSDAYYGKETFSTMEFREALSTLIMVLWKAVGSCLRQRGDKSKCGVESFRCFVVACLYACKRGLSLPNGTTLIPKITTLGNLLPTQRQAKARGGTIRTLHASSHRGFFLIHHAICAVSPLDYATVFAEVARASHAIRTTPLHTCTSRAISALI
jgi:hypothetical protein